MEIERKFLIQTLPENLDTYPCSEIEQGYLCTQPVLRIRRNNDRYIFTYKSAGLMSREEIESPLTREAYLHLRKKCDGHLISKTRYKLPDTHGYTIELDVFHDDLNGLYLAEVEFPTEDEALAYQPPHWFTCEVTSEATFHNSRISGTDPAATLLAARQKLEQA